MADNKDIPAYPFMFDQSQWSNKYSPFYGKAMPFPAQYRGAATDALGRPIQSYQDAQAAHDAWNKANPAPAQTASPVTLNTNPLEAKGSQARAMQDAGYGDWALLDPMMANANRPGATAGAGSVGATSGWNPANPGSAYATTDSGGFGGTQSYTPYNPVSRQPVQQAAPQAAAPTNPIDMNQAYLDALANPGKVTTPGATVPQAPTPSNQSGVLQQFLANWKGGGGQTQGAGNYNNRGFFDALQGQV